MSENNETAPLPDDTDPDAKRVHELLEEVREIMHRRNWPGIALTKCLVNSKTAGAFGFSSWAMNRIKDDESLAGVYFDANAIEIRRMIQIHEVR